MQPETLVHEEDAMHQSCAAEVVSDGPRFGLFEKKTDVECLVPEIKNPIMEMSVETS